MRMRVPPILCIANPLACVMRGEATAYCGPYKGNSQQSDNISEFRPCVFSKTATVLDFEDHERQIIPLRLAVRERRDLGKDAFDDLLRRRSIA